MPEQAHVVPSSALTWNPWLPASGTQFLMSTGSVLGAVSAAKAISEMDVVLDMEANRIMLMNRPGLIRQHFVDFNDLSLAVEAVRPRLTGDNSMWEVFSFQGGTTTLIGRFVAPELPTAQSVLTNPTRVVSQLQIRWNVVSVSKITREAFSRLASEWKQTRNRYSSGIDMFTHPAYQQIIGMGEKVLPLIFEELSRELDHWFWALKAITQADPVASESVGNLAAMRNHWLAWAAKQGYQWQLNSISTPIVAGNFLR